MLAHPENSNHTFKLTTTVEVAYESVEHRRWMFVRRGAISHSERTAQQRHLSVPQLPDGLRGCDRAVDNSQLGRFRLHLRPAGRVQLVAASHANLLRTLRDTADIPAYQLRGKEDRCHYSQPR